MSGMPAKRKLFYTTGEACRMLGIAPHTLRYWTGKLRMSCFKSRGGKRLLRDTEIDLLWRVSELLKEGYTLEGARRRLLETEQFSLPFGGPGTGQRGALLAIRQMLSAIRSIIK